MADAPSLTVENAGLSSGIQYTATITIPAENQDKSLYLGCGVTAQKDTSSTPIQIPIDFDDLEVNQIKITQGDSETTLTAYQSGDAENTYQLVYDRNSSNNYSLNILLNTTDTSQSSSTWLRDTEATLTVTLTVSSSATDTSGNSITDYLADGYTITNYFFGDLSGCKRAEHTATYQSTVQKYSDLSKFLTAIKIYDESDTLQYSSVASDNIETHTLYVSHNYTYELYFAESGTLGSYIEMQPDNNGYMTYDIPTGIHALSNSESWQNITLDNGNAVAQFQIKDQKINLRFLKKDLNGNDSKISWIDSPGLKSIQLRFEGSFTGESNASLGLSETVSVTVSVVDDASLTVQKQAGDYDAKTHTVGYTVTVTGSGNFSDLTMKDTLTNACTIVADSLTVSVDGRDPSSLSCSKTTDGSYQITGLPNLNKGETMTISYRVRIPDDASIYNNATGSMSLTNTAEVTGKSPRGREVTGSNSVTKWIAATNLAKSGYRTDVTADDGTVSVIRWTVTVGDGYSEMGGKTLRDTLGQYLSIYTGTDLEIEAVTKSGSSKTIKYKWTNDAITMSDSGATFSLKLPTSEDESDPYTLFRVRYDTTYEAQESYTTYENLATIQLGTNPIEVRGTCSIAAPGTITFSKTGKREGDYLAWTITVNIPAGMSGTRGFYLTDYYDGVMIGDDGKSIYRSCDLSEAQWTVTATTDAGQVTDFSAYKNDNITENTYVIGWTNRYNSDQSYHNTRAIMFNCTGMNAGDSTWNINEAAILTVTMRIPITHRVDALGRNCTAEEILDSGGFMRNLATLYVASAYLPQQEACINGEPLHKTGTQGENHVIDYQVLLRNKDYETGGADGSATRMDLSGMQSLVFEDTFDSRLEYVVGSLKLETIGWESASAGTVWHTFYYTGGVASDGTLQVEASQFVDDNGKNLSDYQSFEKNNFLFSYQLKLKDEYNDINAASLTLSNTATLKWGGDHPNSVTASTDVSYSTGLLKKGLVDAPENGDLSTKANMLKYQIELNPRAADLDPGSDILTVLDTLPNCLSVLWDYEDQVNVVGEYWDSNASRWYSLDDGTGKVWKKSYYYDTDLKRNVLRFQIPDDLHVRITYQCEVTEYGENVEIVNQVEILGQTAVSDSVDSFFKVAKKSGTASTDKQRFSIIKTDSVTHEPMSGVTFVLYSREHHDNRTPTDGIDETIQASDGNTYYYFGIYTTDENGYCRIDGLNNGSSYVLREVKAPSGYQKMADRYIQYSSVPLESAEISAGFENVFKNQTLSVVNEPIILPVTGGYGTWFWYLLASLFLMLSAGALLHYKRQ